MSHSGAYHMACFTKADLCCDWCTIWVRVEETQPPKHQRPDTSGQNLKKHLDEISKTSNNACSIWAWLVLSSTAKSSRLSWMEKKGAEKGVSMYFRIFFPWIALCNSCDENDNKCTCSRCCLHRKRGREDYLENMICGDFGYHGGIWNRKVDTNNEKDGRVKITDALFLCILRISVFVSPRHRSHDSQMMHMNRICFPNQQFYSHCTLHADLGFIYSSDFKELGICYKLE